MKLSFAVVSAVFVGSALAAPFPPSGPIVTKRQDDSSISGLLDGLLGDLGEFALRNSMY